MLTDTHAHLDFPDFTDDLPALLTRAEAAGVTRILTIGTSVESSRRAVALAEQYPQVFAVVGVHPNNAAEAPPDFIQQLRELARHPRVVGLGETGLDYHRLPGSDQRRTALDVIGDATTADLETGIRAAAIQNQQAIVFEQQLDLARELGLNVVIHERDAWDDTLAILKKFPAPLRAVFHCFGKSPAHAQAILDLGHLVSFTGIVTFKNAPDAQATARTVAAGNFMVETDCPFLAPVPHRGKRCEPAHTRHTAEFIAQLRGESLTQLAAHTTETADAFFRFPR
ncbi:MAG: TatD family hydrolase [Chthoniobacter sp.]|nr:TatD family hydrolase [Chthoniobacter sp.]